MGPRDAQGDRGLPRGAGPRDPRVLRRDRDHRAELVQLAERPQRAWAQGAARGSAADRQPGRAGRHGGRYACARRRGREPEREPPAVHEAEPEPPEVDEYEPEPPEPEAEPEPTVLETDPAWASGANSPPRPRARSKTSPWSRWSGAGPRAGYAAQLTCSTSGPEAREPNPSRRTRPSQLTALQSESTGRDRRRRSPRASQLS